MRRSKALKHIGMGGKGVEIGPCHNALAAKRDGYNVHIIDRMSREGLVERYKNHPIDLDRIEDVDFVWDGQSYADLTGKRDYYDWVIASHVIEHTPDLIGFLIECDSILKEDGVLSLVVPDKRYCFDHFRPISGLARIVDAHSQACTKHSPGAIAEYYLNVVSKADQIAWAAGVDGEYKLLHTFDNARSGMKSASNGGYIDVHAWCFVPHSFRLIIHDLYELGIIPFREVGFHPTEGCEFYMTLGRQGAGLDISRLALLERVETEVKDQASAPSHAPKASLVKRLMARLGKT